MVFDLTEARCGLIHIMVRLMARSSGRALSNAFEFALVSEKACLFQESG